MEEVQGKPLESVIEALIFAAAEPITYKDIKHVYPHIDNNSLKNIIQSLNDAYKQTGRSFHIIEIANGWQLVTLQIFANELKELYNHRIKQSLSPQALETLAIIAYKQPITKIDIDNIRGVSSVSLLKTLLKKRFIKMVGRQDVPGKPIIYATTDLFLQYFGLLSLKDLPKINDLVVDDYCSSNEKGKKNELRELA